MSIITTAHDIRKNSTYKNKERLKEIGFKWNKEIKKWQKEGLIDPNDASDLLQAGIKINPINDDILKEVINIYECNLEWWSESEAECAPPVDPRDHYTGVDAGTGDNQDTIKNETETRDLPPRNDARPAENTNDKQARDHVEFFTHAYPDEKFNHGRYLNSRAKNNKMIDDWYWKKLVPETATAGLRFLITRNLQLGTRVIISIQDYDFNGKQGTTVRVYSINENNLIVDKAKLRVDKGWEKKQGNESS